MNYRTLTMTEWAVLTAAAWVLLALSWLSSGFDVAVFSGLAVVLLAYLLVDRIVQLHRARSSRPSKAQAPGDDVL